MKKYLVIITFLGLSIVSCSTKKTDFSKLLERNGVIFLINSDKPFTGDVVRVNNDKLEFEGSIKDGLRDGVWTYYFPNGQKNFEGLFKDGVKEGKWTFWKDNGQEVEFEMYKYGKLINDNRPKNDTTRIDTTKKGHKPDEAKKMEQPKKPSPDKVATIPFVNWEQLKGKSVKSYNGVLYTGGFIKYYSTGIKSLVGYYTNGQRSGKWTYYDKKGNVKDVRNY